MENKDSGLLGKVNKLASSKFELIVVDKNTGVVYRRNTDWEWAGGNLYNPMGQLSQETLGNPVLLHKRVHLDKDFWNQVKGCNFTPSTINLDYKWKS